MNFYHIQPLITHIKLVIRGDFVDKETKAEIGKRLRAKRESAGYTREQLSELCSLSPRFLANVELGDSAFSLDTLMTVCKILSCSSDELLFGNTVNQSAWSDTTSKISQLDVAYKESIDKTLQGILELIRKAKQGPNRS